MMYQFHSLLLCTMAVFVHILDFQILDDMVIKEIDVCVKLHECAIYDR